MSAKKTSSISCLDCNLTITEPKTKTQIREKLRGLGWRFCSFVGRCAKCEMERQHTAQMLVCNMRQQFRADMPLADMVSPWAVQ